MASRVIYNGVELHNVVTRDFTQEVTYDASNTDLLFQKFHLKVEGICHAQFAPIGGEGTPAWIAQPSSLPNTAASGLKTIQELLSQPRATFEFHVGDELLLSAQPTNRNTLAAYNRDVNNGPHPVSVQVTHIAGSKLFRVAFTIDVCLSKCPYVSGQSTDAPQIVLNNRWSTEESLDENLFMTRTISGDLRLSADTWTLGHDFRHIVVPYLENGFKRASMNFSVDKTGLVLTYRVTDRQIHNAPPLPATSWNVTHTESTNDGITGSSEVNCRLDGPPHVDKRMLFMRAFQIVDAKINYAEAKDSTEMVIESAQVIDHIGDANSVEVNLRMKHVSKKTAGMQLCDLANKDKLGTPITIANDEGLGAYDPTISFLPFPWGYVPMGGPRGPLTDLWLQCYLQNPCNAVHSPGQIQAGQSPGDERNPEHYTPEITQQPPGSIPYTPTDDYGDTHREALYTYARMETELIVNRCRAQMPIARDSSTVTGQTDENRDTCVMFDLADGVAQRVLRVDAERVGKWPQIPKPIDKFTDGALKGYLLDYRITPHPPVTSVDPVKKIFRITAYYLYALNRPPRLNEPFNTGVLPYTNYEPSATQFVPAEVYEDADRLGLKA